MEKTQFAITDALTAADIKIIRNQLKMTQRVFFKGLVREDENRRFDRTTKRVKI